MSIDSAQLKKILVDESYISKEDLEKAEKNELETKTDYLDYLIREEVLDLSIIGQAIAEFYKVPFANLKDIQPSVDIITKLPENIATKYNVVLFNEAEKEWHVATGDPENKELRAALKEVFKGKIVYSFAFVSEITELFQAYKKPLETRFSKIIENEKRIAPELVEEIISDAVSFHASDIHFEPGDSGVLIRFRIDGVLRQAGSLPKEFYESVLNRIKILSGMRIDEHFATQDGSMRLKIGDSEVDLRISVAPTLNGEKVVARLLGEYVKGFALSDLGLSEGDEQTLIQAAKKPFGMILVTGPTGSGKTTTLYSLIKFISNPEINITTIEDPVEYKIDGTNQIQVNAEKGITFADGLRSIVRQDPDVVLVGEIRDQETADIAVNAALTGHLLFSTFHANDAATAIPRLLDMGVEPFLLASTLEVIIAQRLLRRICPNCRYSVEKSPKQIDEIIKGASKILGDKHSLYEGKGCKSCNNSGYRGRIAVYEFIKVTPELKDLVLTNPSSKQIWDMSAKQGARSLLLDGLDKVMNGITTLEEVRRVIAP